MKLFLSSDRRLSCTWLDSPSSVHSSDFSLITGNCWSSLASKVFMPVFSPSPSLFQSARPHYGLFRLSTVCLPRKVTNYSNSFVTNHVTSHSPFLFWPTFVCPNDYKSNHFLIVYLLLFLIAESPLHFQGGQSNGSCANTQHPLGMFQFFPCFKIFPDFFRKQILFREILPERAPGRVERLHKSKCLWFKSFAWRAVCVCVCVCSAPSTSNSSKGARLIKERETHTLQAYPFETFVQFAREDDLVHSPFCHLIVKKLSQDFRQVRIS